MVTIKQNVEKLKRSKSTAKNSNRRYQASKADSVIGFLMSGKPKASEGFDSLTDISEPYIRPQDQFYEEAPVPEDE